ncbi:MAG: MMPL family transporter, partial [Proteobacteria bacterium]|nr:MMPL family transporter [Pseudomonadota bacterium]
MANIRHKLASLAIHNPWRVLAAMLFITVIFSLGLRNLEVKTIFSDLFPKTHPFVKAYKDHPNFGNPLTVTMMVKRTDGKDIYTAETMDKVWKMSRDIDLVPGVDHDQIVSVATGKARYTVLTADGIYSNPIMDEKAPTTPEELAEVKRRVNESPVVRSFLVSQDGTAAIINATFIERLVDYGVVFDGVQDMIKKYEDGQHKVYVAGWPTLTGWAYHFGADTIKIFAVTLSLMFIFLLIAMRNTAGVLTPVLVSTFSTIWGFGFVGWIHDPVEPLLMVVPLLLIARCFSHSVQATERYYELLAEVGDKRKAAEMSLAVMIAPGTLGIFTDVCGLLLVALAPIPALERFAIFTGFWALMLVPTSVIMTPVLLSLLPAPKNVERLVGHSKESGFINKFLNSTLTNLAKLGTGKNARITGGVFIVLALISLALVTRLQVGNPVEGSNLLRYDSEFNTAVRAINRSFPGVM